MRFKHLIGIAILALLPLSAFAWGVVVSSGGVAAAAPAGATTKYVGWANTGGTPDSNPATYRANNIDTTYVEQWTATENGTLKAVNVYIYDQWGASAQSVVVYNGTTLVGHATFTATTNSWTTYVDVVVEEGQSLDFSTNDVISYGVSYDTASYSRVGAVSGTSYKYYANATDGYLKTPISLSNANSYDLALILKYETR